MTRKTIPQFLIFLMLLLIFINNGSPLNLAGSVEAAGPTQDRPNNVDQNSVTFPFQTGFPQSVSFDGVEASSPAVGDVDNDGDYELFVGDLIGDVYGWDHNGNLLPGFPITTGDSIIVAPVALADLDNDTDLEILVGTSSLSGTGAQVDRARVFAWHHNGTSVTGWPQSAPWDDTWAPNWAWNEVTSIAVADIDGDNDNEVLATSTALTTRAPGPNPPHAFNAFAWHHTGVAVSGWPTSPGDWADYDSRVAIYGTLAAGDLTGDGAANPIIPRDYNILYAYDGSGNFVSDWPVIPFYDPNTTWGSDTVESGVAAPVLADLNGDGQNEVIHNGIRQTPGEVRLSSAIMVFQRDGSRFPGWEFPASGSGWQSSQVCAPYEMVSVANLDDDADLELVVSNNDGFVRAYNTDKSLLWSFDYTLGQNVISSEAVIGDIDGDGEVEIVFNTYQPNFNSTSAARVWALETDGSIVTGFPLDGIGSIGVCSAPALSDLDNDGDVELIVATASSTNQIIVWDLPGTYNAGLMPWPQGRHNAQRTATYVESTSNLSSSTFAANPSSGDLGETTQFSLTLQNSGLTITQTVTATVQIPTAFTDVQNITLTPNIGAASLSDNTLTWQGILNQSPLLITYQASVAISETLAVSSDAVIEYPAGTFLNRPALFIANSKRVYLPAVLRN